MPLCRRLALVARLGPSPPVPHRDQAAAAVAGTRLFAAAGALSVMLNVLNFLESLRLVYRLAR